MTALDRHPCRIENKGGSRQFIARKIAVTSRLHPSHIYQDAHDVAMLVRRVDHVS
jgi:hypothetical protein